MSVKLTSSTSSPSSFVALRTSATPFTVLPAALPTTFWSERRWRRPKPCCFSVHFLVVASQPYPSAASCVSACSAMPDAHVTHSCCPSSQLPAMSGLGGAFVQNVHLAASVTSESAFLPKDFSCWLDAGSSVCLYFEVLSMSFSSCRPSRARCVRKLFGGGRWAGFFGVGRSIVASSSASRRTLLMSDMNWASTSVCRAAFAFASPMVATSALPAASFAFAPSSLSRTLVESKASLVYFSVSSWLRHHVLPPEVAMMATAWSLVSGHCFAWAFGPRFGSSKLHPSTVCVADSAPTRLADAATARSAMFLLANTTSILEVGSLPPV